jgi:hypothetical protein
LYHNLTIHKASTGTPMSVTDRYAITTQQAIKMIQIRAQVAEVVVMAVVVVVEATGPAGSAVTHWP